MEVHMFPDWKGPSLSTFRMSRRRLAGITGAFAGAGALGPLGAAPARSTSAHPSLYQGDEAMAYDIEGRLLEVCTCNVLCPCWVGEDPDGGTCDSSFGWAVDRGIVDGVDVSGLTLGLSVHIPGNVFAGNWRAVVYVDDRSTEEQQEALLQVFTGQLGGPIADIAALIGEVIAVERVPIAFAVEEGEGTLTIGDYAEMKLAPFMGATGNATVLQESVFSTIPGSPAYVGKAEYFRRTESAHGLADVDISGHNAIQGAFHFTA
jgi:hypothetical protein